jgi:methylated-DNA-[protein]-cysteine S-methyltransferase
MENAGIYAADSDPIGRAVRVGVAAGRVVSVDFPPSVPPDADGEHPLLDRVLAHLAGEPDDLEDVTVALTVPTDRRRVLESVRSIPAGHHVSLERLARLAGLDPDDEEDVRTVEAALRENPVPVFVPDHRVAGPGATPPEVAEHLRSLEADA